jgi:hypothetical protein
MPHRNNRLPLRGSLRAARKLAVAYPGRGPNLAFSRHPAKLILLHRNLANNIYNTQ